MAWFHNNPSLLLNSELLKTKKRKYIICYMCNIHGWGRRNITGGEEYQPDLFFYSSWVIQKAIFHTLQECISTRWKQESLCNDFCLLCSLIIAQWAGAHPGNNACPDTWHYIHSADAFIQNDLHFAHKLAYGAIWGSVFFSRTLEKWGSINQPALPADLRLP